MKFEIYKDAKKQWRWRLVSRNGRKRGDSGEGHLRWKTVLAAILSFARDGVPVYKLEGRTRMHIGTVGEQRRARRIRWT